MILLGKLKEINYNILINEIISFDEQSYSIFIPMESKNNPWNYISWPKFCIKKYLELVVLAH